MRRNSRHDFSSYKQVILHKLYVLLHKSTFKCNLRSYAISAEQKLYSALRFYATGSFQMVVADLNGLSQPSVSRNIAEVSNAIASLHRRYIFMPRTREEINKTYRDFFEIASFPTVVGTIDCTHVKIKGQGGEDGEVFRNRKQFFSINVQSVASADLRFQDIVARWPGSTHDSHIFNESNLKRRFQAKEFGNSVLLADGGYKLQTYMMTPFRNPANADQMRYNRVQILVRNTVERKYGVWKKRFPCLVFGLRCDLENSLAVIVACAVLHNICIKQNDPMPPINADIDEALLRTFEAAENGSDDIATRTGNLHRAAILKRESFVAQIAQMH